MPSNPRRLRNLWMVFLLVGCAAPQPLAPTGPLPPVQEVVARYNANLERVDRLWARGIVEFHWTTDHGKKRFEQGDAHLVTVLPDRVALSIEKLGRTYLWAGCDPKWYWFFDLTDENDKQLYVGAHDAPPRLGLDENPLPFRPLDLPRLLGLVRLDPQAAYDLTWSQGHWLIEPRVGGPHTRMLLDPDTARAARVELLDEIGLPVVVSRLSDYEPMKLVNAPPGAYPWIATRARVELVGRDARLSLSLSDATDKPEKIKDRLFDLEVLRQALGPVRVTDVDEAP